MRIALIDNYDSFTMNLFHALEFLRLDGKPRAIDDAEADIAMVDLFLNDSIDATALIERKPDAVMLSPGPSSPDKAGNLMALVAATVEARIPLFGVCLGMQAIGLHFGVPVIRAPKPIHGKSSAVAHDQIGLFDGIPSPMRCGRYHSLCLDPSRIEGSGLRVTGWSDGSVLPHDPTWGGWSDPRVVRRESPVASAKSASSESGRRVALARGFGRRGESGSYPAVNAAPVTAVTNVVADAPASPPVSAIEPVVVMAIQHESLPIWGVQFHPESILTPDGPKLMANWLRLAGGLS